MSQLSNCACYALFFMTSLFKSMFFTSTETNFQSKARNHQNEQLSLKIQKCSFQPETTEEKSSLTPFVFSFTANKTLLSHRIIQTVMKCFPSCFHSLPLTQHIFKHISSWFYLHLSSSLSLFFFHCHSFAMPQVNMTLHMTDRLKLNCPLHKTGILCHFSFLFLLQWDL
ncbi:CLUMA_CG010392, isoform A [Clunio marinus]|uniref:CLUMA_CG010392, isoform A n=1 Tax=Clunio marinus TaxID=568069 RepID=A0A1J1IBQ2_9DIPT|nr:CLUMA_CG010392, isoform A [Clunio marinus]